MSERERERERGGREGKRRQREGGRGEPESPRRPWPGQSVPAITGGSRCGGVAAAAAPLPSPGAGVIYYSFAKAPRAPPCLPPPEAAARKKGARPEGSPQPVTWWGRGSGWPSLQHPPRKALLAPLWAGRTREGGARLGSAPPPRFPSLCLNVLVPPSYCVCQAGAPAGEPRFLVLLPSPTSTPHPFKNGEFPSPPLGNVAIKEGCVVGDGCVCVCVCVCCVGRDSVVARVLCVRMCLAPIHGGPNGVAKRNITMP